MSSVRSMQASSTSAQPRREPDASRLRDAREARPAADVRLSGRLFPRPARQLLLPALDVLPLARLAQEPAIHACPRLGLVADEGLPPDRLRHGGPRLDLQPV